MIRKMFVMAWLLATLIGSAAAQDGLTPQTKQKFAKRNYFLALKKPYRAFGVLMKRSWKCHSGKNPYLYASCPPPRRRPGRLS